jgi:WD40 repeat protein
MIASVNALQFSKNSEFLCAGLGDGVVRVWNMQSKKNTANLIQQ